MNIYGEQAEMLERSRQKQKNLEEKISNLKNGTNITIANMYIRDFILQNHKIKEDRNMDNETKIQNQSRRGMMEDKEEWRMEDLKLIQRIENERYNIN